jgi:uridine kinase
MEKIVRIFCKNTNTSHNFPIGTTVLEVYKDLKLASPYQVVAAYVNNKVEDLNFPIYKPKDIEFINLSSSSGMRVYVRTLCMVMAKAIADLYPNATLCLEHPISKGYYFRISNLKTSINQEIIETVKSRITELIRDAKKIISIEMQTSEVRKLFMNAPNHEDKQALFETLNTPYCRYFKLDDYIDYYNGVLLPSTDYLHVFDIISYYDGILLRVPNRDNPVELDKMVQMPKMYEVLKEYVSWNKILNMNNVGEFNIACRNNKSFNLIKIAEALHEKKVAAIADMINLRSQKPRFILVSGPSSSGKTTFSKRLSIQLMVSGLKPLVISLDNYFVNREDTPLDEKGDWDFEDLNALDLPLFNQHLNMLLDGKVIDLPSYNFETGKREYKGEQIHLKENSLLILEGIHALNPQLIPEISEHLTFKIYVSALTTISIDNRNWIPTTDIRLLRRIIRDFHFRNYSARQTISRWSSVRKGEEKWIFPFQENADVMFNSALLFELAVLKIHAEPILAEVPKYCEEYCEAHRLLKFLNYFAPIQEKEIPPTSLLREFVGGSSFKY